MRLKMTRNRERYTLEFTEIFVKQFAKLSKIEQKEVYKKIQELKSNPKRHKPLRGPFKGCSRIRVGSLRIIFMVIEKEKRVYLIDVDLRKRIYKKDMSRIIAQISGETSPQR
jgi:mRNA-degrading endonuclease RelE of RelBE toxin-antitoxin system